MAYVIIEKASATAHLESIVSTQDLVNGQFLALGELQADGEARVSAPSGDKTKKLVLHISNGTTYRDDENELDFVLKAGKVGRAYVVEEGMTVAMTFDGFEGTPTKGALVDIAVDGKLEVTATPTAGLQGEVIAIDIDSIAGQMASVRFSK